MPTSSRMSMAVLLFLCQAAMLLQTTRAVDTASDTVESIFSSADGINIGGSVLAIIAIAAGVFICVAGYKLFRAALFIVGFVAGGVLVASVLEHIFDDKSWMKTASWIGFVVGGFIIASLVVSLYTFGIFVAGAAGGVLIAMALNTSFGYKIYPSDPDVALIIWAIIFGVIGGIAAVKFEKPVIVVATSAVGAGVAVWGVGYFAGDYPNADDLKRFRDQNTNGDWVYNIPDAWWAYLAGMVVLFVFGMFIQFRKTGRHVHHSKTRAVPSSSAYVDSQTPPANTARYGNQAINHV